MEISLELDETKSAMQTEEREAKDILASIEEMEIEDQDDLDFAGDILKDIKVKKKVLVAERTKITGPLQQALEATRKLFRSPIQYLDKCEAALKKKIADRHRRAAEEQRKALEEAGKASMKGDKQKATTALTKARQNEVTKTEGITLREIWDYEIVDFPKLFQAVADGKVSMDVLTVDDDVMSAIVKEQKEKTNIPGIKVFTKTSVSARTK